MSITRAVQPDLRKKRVNWQKVAVILLFAIVPMFLMILFTYIPFIKMIQFSFYNMSYTKNRGFVGLDNYLKVFSKSEYVGAMLLSLYYMAGAVVQLSLALLFASILSLERIRGAGIYKAILFFPFLVNGIAIGYIFKYFYTRGFVLDSVLQAIGIPLEKLPYWLRDQSVNNWSLVFTSVWKYCGQNMVLFIGAIMSVDAELYEAASLDGANRFQQFFHIILPSIKTIVTLNVILSITGSLSAFEPPFVITGGANGTGTYFVIMNEIAHVTQKVGLASAMAVVLLVIIFIVTILQKLFFKYVFREADA